MINFVNFLQLNTLSEGKLKERAHEIAITAFPFNEELLAMQFYVLIDSMIRKNAPKSLFQRAFSSDFIQTGREIAGYSQKFI